ncbi:golvesin C-terminal-like domain-containing protein [Sedimentisphaera salicampi]|uniref:golvesin C-terminal-like domain-containing protein n=1 Tax=Sedimentisphaera salicampi TaxID=1941349 RepID=UPI000B9BB4B7|nr:hypothetical protein [Sedimentisphaera salicampi]
MMIKSEIIMAKLVAVLAAVLLSNSSALSAEKVFTYRFTELDAEVSKGASLEVRKDSAQASSQGSSYQHAYLSEKKQFVEFAVDVPEAGFYALQVRQRNQPDNGIYELLVGSENDELSLVGEGLKIDQGDLCGEYSFRTVNLGVHRFQTAGSKKFRFKAVGKNKDSESYNLSFSELSLKKIQPLEVSDSSDIQYVSDVNSQDGFYYRIKSDSPGAVVKYPVQAEKDGFYVILIRNVLSSAGAEYKVSFDNKNLGSKIDSFNPDLQYSMFTAGVVEVDSPGGQIVKLKITGKNSLSSGYSLNFDTIRLVDPDIIVTSGWGINSSRVKGWWPKSTYADNHYGRFYRYSRAGHTRFYRTLKPSDEPEIIAWRPWQPDFQGFLVSGWYNVYYWLPDGDPDRASNAKYTVHHRSGQTTYTVDQRKPGGEWKLLGTHFFEKGRAGRSGYVELSNEADGLVIADSIKYEYAEKQGLDPKSQSLQDAESGSYTVRLGQEKQTVWGLGVEIQPEAERRGGINRSKGIPGDLTESERKRFYNELLGFGHGFRYMRLPMGLFYTGLDDERKQFQQNWSSQNSELAEMIDESGIEGFNFEYWSPAPYFKSNNRFVGGSLKKFDKTFLTEFGNSIVKDLRYVQENIAPVKMFSLQNEPTVGEAGYGCCEYSGQEYCDTFRAVAPIVKNEFPELFIHADSQAGQYGKGSILIRDDSKALEYVDGWSWHRVGKNSDEQIRYSDSRFKKDAEGRPVLNVEFEYLDGAGSQWRFVNTAQSIMNWFAFNESPAWFWLHALKPTDTLIGERFGLGFWRPSSDNDFTRYVDIKKKHWQYNWYHWNAVAGFLKYMPWDSVVCRVDEEQTRKNQRILAWKTPEGKLVIALTNRSSDTPFEYNIDMGVDAEFKGYRYTSQTRNNIGKYVGIRKGRQFSRELSPFSVEFWVQQ